MGTPFKIATLASHSALQILKGARDEGFPTILVCERTRENLYNSFNVADEHILIDSTHDFTSIEPQLMQQNCIIVPHASFIAYMGWEKMQSMKPMYYGNKSVIKWESDRNMQREWLARAGMKLPIIFPNSEAIDRSVIVKLHGARGGEGYFLARNPEDFKQKIKFHEKSTYVIQEYIIGVPIYIHYFYSPVTEELEIMGFDKRYESNVDSIGRISARDQIALEKVDPSYVIVGNIPLVLRESLLPLVYEMGEKVVKASKELASPGLFGPFCLETILTPELDFYVFEISARIVAGTNLFVNGSPYTDLKYGKPMSTGRRIALDIKQAIEQDKLHLVVD